MLAVLVAVVFVGLALIPTFPLALRAVLLLLALVSIWFLKSAVQAAGAAAGSDAWNRGAELPARGPLVDSDMRVVGGVIVPPGVDVTWPDSIAEMDHYEEAMRQGAVACNFQIVDITIQNPGDQEIVVHRPRIEIDSLEPPLEGVHAGSQSGGMLSVRTFWVTIERGKPPKYAFEDVHGGAELAPKFKVGPDDPESFSLEVVAVDCTCRWRAFIDWVADGERGSTPILANLDLTVSADTATRGFFNVLSKESF